MLIDSFHICRVETRKYYELIVSHLYAFSSTVYTIFLFPFPLQNVCLEGVLVCFSQQNCLWNSSLFHPKNMTLCWKLRAETNPHLHWGFIEYLTLYLITHRHRFNMTHIKESNISKLYWIKIFSKLAFWSRWGELRVKIINMKKIFPKQFYLIRH